MNNMQIKDKIRNICKNKNVDFNTVFKLYMYDRFIERLAVSKYKDNFILKGGFYLSTLFGIENRSTRDIDTAFRNDDFTEINIIRIIKEILEIDIEEKLETILTKGEINGRIRDYYDIYLIFTKDWDNINTEHFRKAVEKTFKKREYNGNIIDTYNLIKNSDFLEKSWQLYSKKYNYSTNVSYQEVMNCLKTIIDVLEPITI